MDLETNDEIIESPTVDDIRRTLPLLGGTENHFAILKTDEMTCLQTSNWNSLGYVLQYQKGSLRNHYQTFFKPTGEQVQRAFLWYLQGDSRWESAFVWTRVELGADKKTDSQRNKSSQDKTSEDKLTIDEALHLDLLP